MMVKYSVIIPVYNSEKTLPRCLDSLVSQCHSNIQILIINDGSTDGSEKIILEYASRYPQIEYIYQENAGVSCARNTGLEHAQGTYITFVDSDDYVADDYFSALDQAEDCDLLVFAHENVGGAPLDETALFHKLQQLPTAAERLMLLLSSRKIMSPWNKRFKRSIIQQHGLRFIEGLNVGEDFNFSTAYAVQCQNIQITDNSIIVNDIADQNSLSRRYRPQLDDKLVSVFQSVAATVSKNTVYRNQIPQLLAQIDYLYVKHVFSCISEEFKQSTLNYVRDHRRIVEICTKFQAPLSKMRCNTMHTALRLALKWNLFFPFYLVSYLVKGRKYRTQ